MPDPMPLRLPESLTHEEAPAAARELVQALQSSSASTAEGALPCWVIDASRLERFDSSALAVLLECQRAAQARGGRIDVGGAPRKLDQLARLYRLGELLPMHAAAQAAPV